jgi:hypothetical protein
MQWRIFLAVTWLTPPFNKLLYAVHKILLQNQNCFSDVEKSVRLNMFEENKMCTAVRNKYELDKGKLE